MIRPAELADASDVLQALVRDLALYFADEVQLFAVWVESSTSVCIIYRRTIDPEGIFGRRISFPPHARPADPTSTGADTAELLREPPGTAMDSAQTDTEGVIWLGVGEAGPPTTPFNSK